MSHLSIGSIVASQCLNVSGRSNRWCAQFSDQQSQLPTQGVGGQRFHPGGHTGFHQGHIENRFRNHVDSDHDLIAIIKIDNVRASVKDRIRVGEPNMVVVPVTLARGDTSFDQRTTFWRHDLRAGIIIAHFERDLNVTIVRVNDMGIIKISRVRGQVFGRDVLCRSRRPKVSTNGFVKLAVFLKMDGTLKLFIVNSLTAKSFRREQNSYFLVGTYSIST